MENRYFKIGYMNNNIFRKKTGMIVKENMVI